MRQPYGRDHLRLHFFFGLKLSQVRGPASAQLWILKVFTKVGIRCTGSGLVQESMVPMVLQFFHLPFVPEVDPVRQDFRTWT